MVQYDPRVLHEHAERLYREAKFIILRYSLVGLLLGFVTGVAGGALLGSVAGNAEVLFALIGAVVLLPLFTAIGYMQGRGRAFALKLQAQTALCQVQIETNTRRQ